MVGRHKELSLLTDAVAARRGAVITGLAGVGKTTLALSGVEWAVQRGMAPRRASATRASQGLPFGALASLLPPERGEADRSLEDLGLLLGRYARAMIDEAHGVPLLVFVDDAHLLDQGSALLVHQMALSQAGTVLATVRAGEVLPDPVLSLWKDGPAERIEIGVLDDARIEELLVSAREGPVDAAAVRELAGRSRGNPMFLRELVNGALETGALVDAGACGASRVRCSLRCGWWSWWRCAWATWASRSDPCWSCWRWANRSVRRSWPGWPIQPRWMPSRTRV
jgi:hypothetical protein